ncbi:MAG: response regulator transcription factor [Nevskiaceae bacterium]|nr:MAG: response regulator transcription factor [Nevskiaceae bacterium]TBR73641.1 MAG: response regulator transcription factor [Nevskiaceae bacterium]
MTAATRVLLVDDHAVVRAGYRRLLENSSHIAVVGEAADASAAYTLYRDLAPDVVVMDIALRNSSGIVALRHIRARDPAARVLIFSMHEDAVFVTHAMDAGALGYITKSSAPKTLVAAVHAVAAGQRFLGPEAAQALDPATAADTPFEALTAHELEVLRLVLSGWSAEEVATALRLSAKTVANLRWSIKHKTGADNFLQLMPAALQAGLLSLAPADAMARDHG